MRRPLRLLCLTLLLGACAAGEDIDASSTFFTMTTTDATATAATTDTTPNPETTGDSDSDSTDAATDTDTDSGDGDGDPPTTTGEPQMCGNDMKEGDEECDGNDLGGLTCVDFGFQDGSLVCADDCTLFTNACSTCGDGQIAATEACDGNNFGGLTCVDLGYAGGTLTCSPDCSQVLETNCQQAPTCGNGALDPGEACDGGNLNGEDCVGLGFDGGALSCSQACQFDTSACTLEQCVGLLGACNLLLQDCCEGLTCNLICLPDQ